ncbi:ankyrin repeat-containing domain protein [Obelidium mucronatum]|nr:ankyrin repeat-containing domain protein [Obelidium mucronatum]
MFSQLPAELVAAILAHLRIDGRLLDVALASRAQLAAPLLADTTFARRHVRALSATSGAGLWAFLDAGGVKFGGFRALPANYGAAVYALVLAEAAWPGAVEGDGRRAQPDVVSALRAGGRPRAGGDAAAAAPGVVRRDGPAEQSLLLKHERVDPSAENQLALQYAVEYGHSDVVEALLKDDRVDPSQRDGNRMIKLAATFGRTAIARLLLKDSRVDPSVSNNFAIVSAARNWACRHCGIVLVRSIRQASEEGHHLVVKLLMQDPRVNPSSGNDFALVKACLFGHIQVVKLLLTDKRVDPCSQLQASLCYAARSGHSEIVQLLLSDERVDPSRYNQDALVVARESGQWDIASILESRIIENQLKKSVATKQRRQRAQQKEKINGFG